MRITKVYTKTGDKGLTSLASGERVSKTHVRIKACGAVDELNSFIGLALSSMPLENLNLKVWLEHVQHDLFNIGSELSITDLSQWEKLKKVSEIEVMAIEECIDLIQKELPPLENFILPGGSSLAAQFHICRTVCRRAEIAILELEKEFQIRPQVLKYINRLSDLMFVVARYSIKMIEGLEILWTPSNGLSTCKSNKTV